MDTGEFPVESLKTLSAILEAETEDITALSIKRDRARRGEKRSNGEYLYHPSLELNTLLKKVDKRLLRGIHFPEFFCSVGGKGSVQHAKTHSGQAFLLNTDIKRFFYSVHSRKVKQIFSDLLGCPNDVAFLLTRLTTFNDITAPGFPTSPRIAALAFLPVEKGLSQLCRNYKLKLSIFADDIEFSVKWDFAPVLFRKIKFIIKTGGFKINPEKTIYRGTNHGKSIAKLRVSNKVNVPDKMLNEIKKTIRNFLQGVYTALSHQEQHRRFLQLAGSVNYVNQVNPQIGDRLLLHVTEIKSKLPLQPVNLS